jgi:tRNA nucleotidyltransferase (CCA-adding enzyme)
MKVAEFARDLENATGGSLFKVGGCVRDVVFNKESKDVDCELFGVLPEQLVEFIKSENIEYQMDPDAKFPVYHIQIDNEEIEIGFPRRDNKTGHKHSDFEIEIDPFMSLKDASVRRDFTCNAMYQSFKSDTILDPHNGLEDIRNNVLRPVDAKTFVEDPLRLFRAFQFIARFGFDYEPVLELCTEEFVNETKHLSKDSIFKEFEKAIVHGKHFVKALSFLKDSGLLKVHFPDLDKLSDCQQSHRHHAEGNVWKHTMMVVDAMMNQ